MYIILILKVGQKREHLAPLGYPVLLDHGVSCHGQHLRSYEVIEGKSKVNVSAKNKRISLPYTARIPAKYVQSKGRLS